MPYIRCPVCSQIAGSPDVFPEKGRPSPRIPGLRIAAEASIDGDHAYDGVKRDFECWLPHLTPNPVIAFDDSKDPDLGPRKLIDELLADGRFEQIRQVGKVTVLRRGKA